MTTTLAQLTRPRTWAGGVAALALLLTAGCEAAPPPPPPQHAAVDQKLGEAAAPAPHGECGKPTWSYEQPQGPAQGWKDKCENGVEQSPIALTSASPTVEGPPVVQRASCTPIPVKLINEGYTVSQAIPEGACVFQLAGIDTLRAYEMHFHTQAEHHLKDVGGDQGIEVHIKTWDKDGKSVVFAIVFDTSGNVDDPALATMFQYLPGLKLCERAPKGPPPSFDINPWIAPFMSAPPQPYKKAPYFRYRGSLTTPPCDGNVDFYVRASPVPASAAQVKALRDMIGSVMPTSTNARNEQRLNSPPRAPVAYVRR